MTLNEEKKIVIYAFMRSLVALLMIGAIVVFEVVMAVFIADLWMVVSAILTGVLLFWIVPLAFGAYPFFAARATRFARWFNLPKWFALFVATFATLALSSIYPLKFAQGMYLIGTVIAILPISTIAAAILGVLTKIIVQKREVEVAIPKCVTFSASGLSSWAISSPELMKRSDGVPIAIINHTRRTLVLTMIWLEWFAPIRVPKSFHREFVLETLHMPNRCSYYNKVIELGQSCVVKPRDAIIWILHWDEARSFYEELRSKEMVKPREAVPIRIAVYDEYHDRVHSSREIPLNVVLSEQYALRVFDSLNKTKTN